MAVPLETARGGIRTLRFEDPEPALTVGLVWRKASALTADIEALGALITDALADVPEVAA